MQLPQDFKEFIALMISTHVRFVMIGGYAYNLYRNPRATGDIDFFVAISDENEQRLRNILTDFGFGESLPNLSTPILVLGKVLMLGRPPLRIDILTKIDGVTFNEVESTCLFIDLEGLRIPVISPEMLLRNKESTGRAKDASDALELRRMMK
ncbi:MAG: nucleotidyl transferase AbiEii/AbiGii toxin family protein [Planctomycetota bacterium]|nr:nucleotidyl transferase AbiEii/AbiGii toxin family protein [Planctomycetota bacterium]